MATPSIPRLCSNDSITNMSRIQTSTAQQQIPTPTDTTIATLNLAATISSSSFINPISTRTSSIVPYASNNATHVYPAGVVSPQHQSISNRPLTSAMPSNSDGFAPPENKIVPSKSEWDFEINDADLRMPAFEFEHVLITRVEANRKKLYNNVSGFAQPELCFTLGTKAIGPISLVNFKRLCQYFPQETVHTVLSSIVNKKTIDMSEWLLILEENAAQRREEERKAKEIDFFLRKINEQLLDEEPPAPKLPDNKLFERIRVTCYGLTPHAKPENAYVYKILFDEYLAFKDLPLDVPMLMESKVALESELDMRMRTTIAPKIRKMSFTKREITLKSEAVIPQSELCDMAVHLNLREINSTGIGVTKMSIFKLLWKRALEMNVQMLPDGQTATQPRMDSMSQLKINLINKVKGFLDFDFVSLIHPEIIEKLSNRALVPRGALVLPKKLSYRTLVPRGVLKLVDGTKALAEELTEVLSDREKATLSPAERNDYALFKLKDSITGRCKNFIDFEFADLLDQEVAKNVCDEITNIYYKNIEFYNNFVQELPDSIPDIWQLTQLNVKQLSNKVENTLYISKDRLLNSEAKAFTNLNFKYCRIIGYHGAPLIKDSKFSAALNQLKEEIKASGSAKSPSSGTNGSNESKTSLPPEKKAAIASGPVSQTPPLSPHPTSAFRPQTSSTGSQPLASIQTVTQQRSDKVSTSSSILTTQAAETKTPILATHAGLSQTTTTNPPALTQTNSTSIAGTMPSSTPSSSTSTSSTSVTARAAPKVAAAKVATKAPAKAAAKTAAKVAAVAPAKAAQAAVSATVEKNKKANPKTTSAVNSRQRTKRK